MGESPWGFESLQPHHFFKIAGPADCGGGSHGNRGQIVAWSLSAQCHRSAGQHDPLGVSGLLKHFLMLKNQAVPKTLKQNAPQVYRCPSAQPSSVQ